MRAGKPCEGDVSSKLHIACHKFFSEIKFWVVEAVSFWCCVGLVLFCRGLGFEGGDVKEMYSPFMCHVIIDYRTKYNFNFSFTCLFDL